MITIQDAKRIRLTANFTLWEFVYSEKAMIYGLMDKQLEISEVEIQNIQQLCDNVLQPLRNEMKESIKINSGFRSLELNEKINGKPNSEHLHGKAADIYVPGKMEMAFYFINNRCGFRQLINEQNLAWIHVSFDANDNKKEVLYL
jgi:zinc D-Ala-D-Ala carboxypeptidase